jgi:5-methylcytosine-specific restriction endonuclease McrA
MTAQGQGLIKEPKSGLLKDEKQAVVKPSPKDEEAIAWAKANPEVNRIKAQNRRALKRVNGGKLSKGLAEKLFKLQKGKCPCCHQPLGENYHLDHIVPLALGGSNTDDNIQLLRSSCNNQKSAKHPIDFMQQRGFLL